MKKFIIITSLIVSHMSFGYGYSSKGTDIKQQISKLKRDISQRERDLNRISRKSQAKKVDVVQQIEEARISKVESKQAEIQNRQQEIDNLKEQLRQLEG